MQGPRRPVRAGTQTAGLRPARTRTVLRWQVATVSRLRATGSSSRLLKNAFARRGVREPVLTEVPGR
jgi:hypothetical protein